MATVEARMARVCGPALTSHPVRWLGLILLCTAYLQGALLRLIDFGGAITEMEHYGMSPARPVAAALILFELGASVMVITGFCRWIGALALAAFTLMATFIALRFWQMPVGPERLMATNAFFEHLGLVGAFLLVAWYDLHKWRRGERDWS